MTESDINAKLRAGFLAFVMITSVFAGTVALSGSAAAEETDPVTLDDPGSPENVTIQSSDFTQETTSVVVNNSTSNTDGWNSNTTHVYFNVTNLTTQGGVDLSSAEVGDVTINDTTDSPNIDQSDISTNVNQNDGNTVARIQFDNVEGNFSFDWNLTSLDTSGADADASGLQYDVNASVGSSVNTDLDGQNDAVGPNDFTTSTFDIEKETELISHATNDATDENAEVNVSITEGVGVDEGTINVNATNENTSDTIKLVEQGQFTDNVSTSDSSGLDGTNDNTEELNISAPLQEGNYTIGVSANDTNGELNQTEFADAFQVNMSGQDLKVVPDSANPLAGNQANVSVVAVDQNGNELIFNESDVGATAGDIQLSYDDGGNVTASGLNADTETYHRPIFNTSSDPGTYNVTFGVNYSEVGDLEITANDFGGNLSSGSATQTYTAEIDDVSVTADDGTLRADGSDTENVTLQLVDQNGDPVPRSGESVDFGVISGNFNDAGLQVSEENETDSEGQAVATYNATTAGETIEVSGQSGTHSDTATFNTTPGDVNTTNSRLRVDGDTADATGTVATELDIEVELKDDGENAVQDAPVTLTANQSGASFADSEPVTNETGIATTTVTLPETSGTLQINASSGAFNASATGNATNNVTVSADNATTLAFSDDSPTSVAPGSQNGVTIEAVDQYGNVNASLNSGDVTLTSDDTSLVGVDGDGQESSTVVLSSGTVDFQAYANSTNTGTATLSATIDDSNISNVSQDITVASPDGLEVSIDRNIASSDVTESGVVQNATLTAQLVDSNGDALGINREEISFARQNGNAATLDATTNHTVSDGSTTVQINSTSNTGQTTFIAVADNYSVQGSGTIVTTGAPDAIGIDAPATVTQGESVNVSAGYVDSEERVVPRTTSIKMSTEIGSFETRNKNPEFNENGQAVATYNYTAPTDDSGNETLTAIGGGNTGSAMLTVEAAASTVDATISADPSNTSATSTHTVTATLSDGADSVGSSLNGVEVDYSGTGADVSNVDQSDIESVTINGDDVSDDLSSASASNNGETLTVGFGGSYNLEAGDEVEITYANAQNPDTEDTYDVTVTVNPQSGADSGTASLTIGETGDGPAIVGDTPAQDLDGDGTFEDVNGDGTFDIVDVNAIFQNRNSDAVQNNPGAFDFNGDGKFDIVDVNRLFQDAQ